MVIAARNFDSVLCIELSFEVSFSIEFASVISVSSDKGKYNVKILIEIIIFFRLAHARQEFDTNKMMYNKPIAMCSFHIAHFSEIASGSVAYHRHRYANTQCNYATILL